MKRAYIQTKNVGRVLFNDVYHLYMLFNNLIELSIYLKVKRWVQEK